VESSLLKRLAAVVTFRGRSRRTKLAACVMVGMDLGAAVLVARVSNAVSYLSEEPETCINCHVMTDAYASRQRRSHGHAAVCTDCHVPHSSAVAKLAFKGADGTKHACVFTMGDEPEVLRLSERAAPVVQTDCARCHADALEMMRLASGGAPEHPRSRPASHVPHTLEA
jgi:cytochrome c nitrite reductase small subunit